jgi:hypothetical protein
MQRGNILVEKGVFLGKKGSGQFLKRSRFHVPAGEPARAEAAV